jgi:4-amino-4-deoxy-L-arabinose transferase-like glycosyltransferase
MPGSDLHPSGVPSQEAEPVRTSSSTRWGRFEWTLLVVVLVGVAVRFAYIWFERRPHFADVGVIGDANFYHFGANFLADGKGFINTIYFQKYGTTQQDAHPPLYILWLTIPSLVGFTTTTAHQLWTLVIGTGTIVAVGYTGREIAGPRTGLIAAALAAVYPNVWSHDAILTSETMSIFAATLCVWMAYRYWHVPSATRAVALGLAVSLAILARSELALFVPLLVVPVVLSRSQMSWSERWKRLLMAGLVILVLIGPWVAYNRSRFDKPVYLSNGLGVTMLTANCDGTYHGPDTGYWQIGCAIPTEDRIKAWTLDQSVVDSIFRHEAVDYIKAHKGRFAVVKLVRWARYAGIWDLTHHFDQVHKDEFPEGREPYVAWTSAFMWFVIAPLAIAGAVVLRRRRIPVYLVAAPIVITIIAVTMTFYQNRYRASAETAFCLLAAVAIDALIARVRREPSPARAEDVPPSDDRERALAGA